MTAEARQMIDQARDLLEDAHRILKDAAKVARERDRDAENVLDALIELERIIPENQDPQPCRYVRDSDKITIDEFFNTKEI
jgi:hypothetical protein